MKDSKKFVLDDPDIDFLDGLIKKLEEKAKKAKKDEEAKITTPITQMNGIDAKAEITYAKKDDKYPYHYVFKGKFLEGEYKGKEFEIECSRIKCSLTVYFK